MRKLNNLTGQIFGKLTILERSENKPNYPNAQWLCKCECGNTTIVSSTNLIHGTTKSCGCLRGKKRIKDLTGQTFGKLVVIERVENKSTSTNAQWLCKCACGDMTIVSSGNLPKTKSCGCLVGQKHGLSSTFEYRMWNSAKNRAKKENIPFTLRLEDLIALKFPDKCPIFNIPLKQNKQFHKDNSPSLDRIIPELGYVKGNVAIISWKANSLKSNGTIDDFLAIITYLRKHQVQ